MTQYSKSGNKDGARIVDFPASGAVESQAARWLAVLDSDNPSPKKIREFKVWIAEDEAHRKEFEALLALWDELNILTQVTPPRRNGVGNTELGNREWGLFPLHKSLAFGFSIVMMLAVAIIAFQIRQPSVQTYTTAIGEQNAVELADSSTVLLNTNSGIEVEYDEHRRRIRFIRGEALFQVESDPERPFEVYAGDGVIRAVGTAFNVYLRESDVEVIVTEGTIAIESVQKRNSPAGKVAPADITNKKSDPPSLPGVIIVDARTRATFNLGGFESVKLAEMKVARMEESLAWRHGILTFDQESLENVVREMGRYTSLKLVIPENEVKQVKLGGIFRLGDTESMFEALEQGFGIRAERVSEGVVYLVSENGYKSKP